MKSFRSFLTEESEWEKHDSHAKEILTGKKKIPHDEWTHKLGIEHRHSRHHSAMTKDHNW